MAAQVYVVLETILASGEQPARSASTVFRDGGRARAFAASQRAAGHLVRVVPLIDVTGALCAAAVDIPE